MSYASQWSAVYHLFYKEDARAAFLKTSKPPVANLSKPELAALKAVHKGRLKRVVELHAGDIGRNWYAPRFPATWLALQVLLGLDEAGLAAFITGSPHFEKRVNDDRDAVALGLVVRELLTRRTIKHRASWLAELLDFERHTQGRWTAPESPLRKRMRHTDAVFARFTYDVNRIHEDLLADGFFPLDVERSPTAWVFVRVPVAGSAGGAGLGAYSVSGVPLDGIHADFADAHVNSTPRAKWPDSLKKLPGKLRLILQRELELLLRRLEREARKP